MIWSLLARTLFAAGLPSWVRSYASRDTQAVIYFNMDNFRKTAVFRKLEELLPSRSEVKRSNGLQLCPDDVRDVFSLVQEDGSSILVLRTYENLSLSKITPKGKRNSQPEKYKGFEYIHFGNEYCAKTGDCTYCIAPSEDSIERALKRLSRKESPHLDKDLESALESVAGNDYYLAATSFALIGERGPLSCMPKHLRRALDKINHATAYVSFGSSISFQYFLAFDNPSDAEDCKEAIDSQYEKMEDALEAVPVPSMGFVMNRKMVIKLAKRCSEATSISCEGRKSTVERS